MKIIFFLLLNIYYCKNKKIFDEKEIKNICSRCHSNFNEVYNNTELLKITKDDDKINEFVIKLIEDIKSKKKSKIFLKEYAKTRLDSSLIIYVILILLILIIWIILIIISCIDNKKKLLTKLFFPKNRKNNFISYFGIALFIFLIILSSINLFFIFETKKYFNDSLCSLFRIYIDLRDGDQTKITDWEGIKNMQEDLTRDENIINQLLNTIELQENLCEDLKENEFEKNIFDEDEKNNNYFSDIVVNSPSKLNEKVFPSYSKLRKENLELIKLEYDIKLSLAININQEISSLNKPIKNHSELITEEFLFINHKLNDILNTVQYFAEKYLTYVIFYSKYINYYIFPLFFIIYILLIIFSIAAIVFTILYIKNNDTNINEKIKNINKKILISIWNIIFFLLILAICLQAAFKILELLSIDSSGFMQYATSEENINSENTIVFKGPGKLILGRCFKDDNGNILSEILKLLKLVSNEISKIEELKIIYLSEIIYQKYHDIYEKMSLDTTENILIKLKNMLDDYSLISYYDDSSLIFDKKCQKDFDDLNKYTDYSSPIFSYQSFLNSKHSYDIWTSSKSNCEKYENYKYINDAKSRKEGNKYCMVIDEFNTEEAKNFYSDIKSIEILSTKYIDDIFSEYHQALIKFKNDNKILLNSNPNFIYRTQKYYDDLISIKNKIIKGIEYSQEITKLIFELISHPSTLDISIDLFSMMECWFVKRDIKAFYIRMESLKNNSHKLLISNLIEIILVIFCILFIIIIIYRYQLLKDEPTDITTINDVKINEDDNSIKCSIKSSKNKL